MPDLLLELFSEEIPARMQGRAAEDLRRLVTDRLVDAGLTYEGAKGFATPRRLALTVHGLTARSPDIREERRGPRVGAPDKAVEGFLRGAGLSSVDEAEVRSDPRKGDFYVAVVDKPGRPAADIIGEAVPQVIRTFPWPKSMRWGARSAPRDAAQYGADAEGEAALRWVRPLRSILCTFGPETEEPEVVPFAVSGLAAGNTTVGHRFMAPGAIAVRRFDDYVTSLEAAKVVLDPDRRRAVIETDARNLAHAQGLELVDDPELLEEVAGLVEWPVVLMGRFDEAFRDIPDEVVRLTIRANQKCFVLRRTEDGGRGAQDGNPSSVIPHPSSSLANRFILVANIEAADGGKAIVAGNERVIAARLSDARFFWDTDRAVKLADWAKKLAGVTFHEKLGSQAERVERIARLARELAPACGADPELAEQAARLCKADLVTGMVGEFPELQGVMGRYYALGEGADPRVADAIRDHYKPQGPSDAVPTEPVSVAVALADKLDMLVGFWAIDEKPTGSKDPYALRRAALGVIRIVLENDLRLGLLDVQQPAARRVIGESYYRSRTSTLEKIERLSDEVGGEFLADGSDRFTGATRAVDPHEDVIPGYEAAEEEVTADLLTFLAERLKVHLRETGARHDLIDAVFAAGVPHAPTSPLAGEDVAKRQEGGDAESRGAGDTPPSALPGISPSRGEIGEPPRPASAGGAAPAAGKAGAQLAPANDDLLMIVRRVEALGNFLDSDDGANLLAGYRRAVNIVRIEEGKDGERVFAGEPDRHLIESRGEQAERELFHVLESVEGHLADHLRAEDFEAAMRSLSELRPAVDAFFDNVMVNTDDAALRANRLKLLNRLRAAMHQVADFSRVAG